MSDHELSAIVNAIHSLDEESKRQSEEGNRILHQGRADIDRLEKEQKDEWSRLMAKQEDELNGLLNRLKAEKNQYSTQHHAQITQLNNETKQKLTDNYNIEDQIRRDRREKVAELQRKASVQGIPVIFV